MMISLGLAMEPSRYDCEAEWVIMPQFLDSGWTLEDVKEAMTQTGAIIPVNNHGALNPIQNRAYASTPQYSGASLRLMSMSGYGRTSMPQMMSAYPPPPVRSESWQHAMLLLTKRDLTDYDMQKFEESLNKFTDVELEDIRKKLLDKLIANEEQKLSCPKAKRKRWEVLLKKIMT